MEEGKGEGGGANEPTEAEFESCNHEEVGGEQASSEVLVKNLLERQRKDSGLFQLKLFLSRVFIRAAAAMPRRATLRVPSTFS